MSIASRIEEIKARYTEGSEFDYSDKSFIESHYELIVFKAFTRHGCSSCYRDAFIEMYLHYKKYGIKKMGEFRLKKGALIHLSGDANVYNRATITDDKAMEILKTHPGKINQFESYPQDWESLVEDFDPTATLADSQLKAEENLVAEIAQKLTHGTSRVIIKKEYKSPNRVGDKPLTNKLVSELIRQAEELNQARDKNSDVL